MQFNDCRALYISCHNPFSSTAVFTISYIFQNFHELLAVMSDYMSVTTMSYNLVVVMFALHLTSNIIIVQQVLFKF